MKRSRLAEVLRAEELRWRSQENWFGERLGPAFAEKREDRHARHGGTRGERGRVPGREGTGGRQELPGPATGQGAARPGRPAERARQEADDGRRGEGDVFGAFPPSSGEAFTVLVVHHSGYDG